MRAATYPGAVFHARNVREGIKGDFWWRQDMDVETAHRLAIQNRQSNLALFDKLGGEALQVDPPLMQSPLPIIPRAVRKLEKIWRRS